MSRYPPELAAALLHCSRRLLLLCVCQDVAVQLLRCSIWCLGGYYYNSKKAVLMSAMLALQKITTLLG